MSLAGFIAAQRAEHGVPHATRCRALGTSQAWLYKWRHGEMSVRRARRRALAAEIEYFVHPAPAPVRLAADHRRPA